ncbi:MAG: hypothetical protein WA067_04980 [Microgenomates group bacterium]
MIENSKIIYNCIGKFSLRDYLYSLGYTNVGDPLPLVKRFEKTDLAQMERGKGVISGQLSEGDLVVISRERKDV